MFVLMLDCKHSKLLNLTARIDLRFNHFDNAVEIIAIEVTVRYLNIRSM